MGPYQKKQGVDFSLLSGQKQHRSFGQVELAPRIKSYSANGRVLNSLTVMIVAYRIWADNQ